VAAVGPLEYVSRAQLQRQQPHLSATDALKLAGGVIAGAAVGTALITKVFPTQRVLMALGVMTGGAIFAGTAPVASLPESFGLGATVSGVVFLGLDIMGQIAAPPSGSTTAGAADAAPPPVARSSAVALRGLAAA
jgi:hypothetical protein